MEIALRMAHNVIVESSRLHNTELWEVQEAILSFTKS